MERLIGMAGAARAAGRHYDTFRKGWRAMVAADGFPAPVRDAAPYMWRPSSLSAWQDRREAATRDALIRAAADHKPPANDARPAPPPGPRGLDAARDAVRALMRA